MRLDKFLCDTLNFTRSEAKKIISSGRVCVGGQPVKNGSVQVEDGEVLLDGQPVSYQKYFYIMLHKPQGYVCANKDSVSRTVFDLLPKDFQKKDLFVCGRLDKDTTGLVLLTNNGAVAHRLLAPKKEIFKEYLVHLRDKVSTEDIKRLKQGITLRDGLQCKPAYFIPTNDRCGMIRISEGKYHQIKRMFGALGNEVVALHRKSIHGLTLDENLEVGQCRYLTEEEIKGLESVK
ncbi:MAG: 16S rRNA pseudouridine(516) synthase [Clostridia bacterium]|nr:16S rRNA pseudouridine(516) synthase [Clostridia bacterium]